jgi:adenylate cyclase
MQTKTEILLREKEIQGITISLYGKIFIAVLSTIISFFVANSLFEILSTVSVNITLTIILYFLLKILRKNKFVMPIGILCVLIDVLIITILPFIYYNSVGGDIVPRTYLVKTYTHTTIYGILLLNAFTIQPLYPLLYAFGVVISQCSILLYAMADPRFQSTESFKEALLGNAAHVNSYILGMAIVGILGFFLAYLTFLVRKTVFSAVSNEVKSSQLSRYFSPNVVDEISQADDSFFTSGGKEQNVAVLFCDIEGFTQLSEELGPEKTIETLSQYHEQMLEVVFNNHGTLDKFLGDGMLVTFGTPMESPNDAENAILAGIAMKSKLNEWNLKRKEENQKPIKIRIGIHFGPVIVGNVGIAKRLEYTVIGDTVNAASRIEALGKEVNRSFLISKDLLSRVKDTSVLNAKFISLGNYALRGKSKTTEIVAVETT